MYYFEEWILKKLLSYDIIGIDSLLQENEGVLS